jgi:hypothetical protein
VWVIAVSSARATAGTGERMTWGKVSRLPARSVKARVNLMQSSTSPGNQPVKIRDYETEQGKIRCSNNNSVLRGRWQKSYAEIKIGIACVKDFDRKERKEFTDVLIKWYKERIADIAIRKEKNNAKLLKITVRYKMQTCDFIINDKFFYGIFKSKICKK